MRAFHAKGEFQLGILIAVGVEFLEQEARLDVGVVLVLAVLILGHLAVDVVVEDLQMGTPA